MVKERTENIFAALTKKGRQKPFCTGIDRGRNRCLALVDNIVDPGVFNKTVILLGLAGYKMIITNSALTLYPALPRRITVKYT